MNRLAAIATLLVAIHHLIAIVHGNAHDQLGVGLNAWQNAFVWIVITIAPIVAVFLYWAGKPKIGGALLFVSMVASLLFGVYFHFVFVSPDHVSHLPEGAAQGPFLWTAVLLVPSEAMTAGFGLWTWIRLRSLKQAE